MSDGREVIEVGLGEFAGLWIRAEAGESAEVVLTEAAGIEAEVGGEFLVGDEARGGGITGELPEVEADITPPLRRRGCRVAGEGLHGNLGGDVFELLFG
jgi:hypothetical protein